MPMRLFMDEWISGADWRKGTISVKPGTWLHSNHWRSAHSLGTLAVFLRCRARPAALPRDVGIAAPDGLDSEEAAGSGRGTVKLNA